MYVNKEDIRKYIWKTMEEKNIAIFPRPVYHRIPNFRGSNRAGLRLVRSKYFDEAKVVFCNPDSPQRIVREHVILGGKTLIMASPRLRQGFIVIRRGDVPRGKERYASTIAGAFKYGKVTDDLSGLTIDLKVTGCVAVTIEGAKLGKGGGYSDLEYAILREIGAIGEDTPVVTSVHEIQIVEYIPMDVHDVPVDAIFTPNRYIKTLGKYPKPRGIYWDKLDKDKIESIPILKRMYLSRGAGHGAE